MKLRSINPHSRKVHPRFLLSFLFLSGIPCIAQEPTDSTAALDSSSGSFRFSPAVRAVQIDPAKIFHGHMWFNGDIDILRRGKSMSAGLRYQFFHTGDFDGGDWMGHSSCSGTLISHHHALAYGSWYPLQIDNGKSLLRITLPAGGDFAAEYPCSRLGIPSDNGLYPVFGAELQVRLPGWLSVSAEYFLLPGHQDLMAHYLPVGIRLGYARW